MTKPIIIYTAIFGDSKDQLHKLPEHLGNVECHAFLDNISKDAKKTGWHLHPPGFQHSNARRQARQHKTLAHELFPEAEISVWVDGTMTPATDVEQLAKRYLEGFDICTYRHNGRTCVYQEGEMCARTKKDDVKLIRDQMDRYHSASYPYHNGMVETMVVLRRHTDAVREFNDLWWAEIEQGSLRDQLSFNYCCWKLGLPYRQFAGDYKSQKDFTFRSHW